MATKDEILGRVGSLRETIGGGNNPSGLLPVKTMNVDRVDAKVPDRVDAPTRISYEQMFRSTSPYKEPTSEEVEKDKKKQKREQIFAAISDGISSLSNLYFASRGAKSSFDGTNSASEKAKERWDKIAKEREANKQNYVAGILRAKKADEEHNREDRNWKRTISLDDLSKKRYEQEQEYKRKRDLANDEWRRKEFDRRERRDAAQNADADRNYGLSVKVQKDSADFRKKQLEDRGNSAVRGKQIGFSDGKGNQVSIYGNVWKGSMQQVYDVLEEDMMAAYKADSKNNPRVKRDMTQAQKEDFVKQYWHKSPRASQIMLTLSKLDPATMKSELEEGGMESDGDAKKKIEGF